jgi:hypothetical protein
MTTKGFAQEKEQEWKKTVTSTFLVSNFIVCRTEQDVIAYCFILDPRFLSSICHAALSGKVEPGINGQWDEVHLSYTLGIIN